ncbi:MAG: head completion/stabilization protein [Azoarcus sp.]|jgi:hypothetical protein|nr:head completion/stabilization protein [Azoarcus sp.]
MSFVATAPAEPLPPINSHPFWPAIEPDECRQLMDLDGNVTNARLVFVLTEAIVSVNADLKCWRKQLEQAGVPSLDAIVDEEAPVAPSRLVYLYQRAVCERAHAELIERYLRYDATGEGTATADELQATADNHRRNSFYAVRDLKGEPRSTMELL